MNETIELFNRVRSELSQMFKDRVPEATINNMESIRYAMLSDDNIQVANEFIKHVINKIAKSVVIAKRFENPLKPLKQGTKFNGDTIEEIYNNFIKADIEAFQGDKLFKRNLPDTKAIYHRMNLELQYPITIDRVKLSKAFRSYEDLDAFIQDVITQLYNSAELEEFSNMKELFKSAYDHNAIKVEKVSNPFLGESQAKEFVNQVKDFSSLMKYPSSNYNAYLTAQSTDTKPIITLSRYREQVLILPEMVNNKINIEVLASAFNMTLIEFNKTRKVLVDSLPVPNCLGALVDEKFFQVWDDYSMITEFFNAKGIYTNYYLNIGQTMAFSPLVNAILFVYGTDESDSNTSVDEFTITKTLAIGTSLSNRRVKVVEGSEYGTNVKGEFTSVSVTMGGTDITSTAYNSETKVIEIAKVTGDITITVA